MYSFLAFASQSYSKKDHQLLRVYYTTLYYFLFLEQCNQIESTVAAIYSSTSKKESRRFYKRLPNKTRSNNHFTQTYMVKIYVKWKKARNPRYHYYLRKFIHNHMRGRVESFVHLCKSRRGLQHQRRLRTMLQKLSKCEVMA